LGCIGKATRPTDTLQGKKFTEENTSWQPRKRLRRRKRNTNRLARRNLAKNPRDLKKASLEKHLRRGFLISVVGRWSLVVGYWQNPRIVVSTSFRELVIASKSNRRILVQSAAPSSSQSVGTARSPCQRPTTNDQGQNWRRQPPAAYGTKMGLFTARHSARNGCVRNSGLPANPQGTSKQAA